ncbi:enoyl-CoA hydratase/isomerase family protein [Trujillonella endophytica]|uniref:2-(1,2-epoxy-1,2-dihydrophenyl)acetyl-CoA isomerase n=1 Tax=Trujillonella endophytica TaxID=673521 RepID=A0A1H8VY88_9ACTN|nr:enoyl-CoA hydratase-related protein [Trujillella endophytica]SEP19888.1 2-(1,2-epoxy-1,2-dihydrophenyl)acetyl-CoA isomerase [Trujillella endophytica]
MTSSPVDGLTVTRSGRVLHVQLSNPRRRNALTDTSMRGFVDLLEATQNDESVGAVLLSGEGGDFCSGFDIVGRNSGDGGRPRVGAIQRRLPSQAHRLIPQLCALQVPVVSAVAGYAVGLGMQLALASDFVVADATATFWQPFVSRGMTPDAGATWLTTRAVGPLRARQLLLLGRRLDADTAAEWGIVHEAVPAGEAVERGTALATELAAGPTVALGLTKALINSAADSTLAAQLAAEGLSLELSSRSPDFKEGLAAFVGKRPPEFTGR